MAFILLYYSAYPQAAGKNIANPIGAILSAAMLLEYSFDLIEESNAIKNAVNSAVEDGFLTEDLNKNNAKSTTEVGDKIAELIRANSTVLEG